MARCAAYVALACAPGLLAQLLLGTHPLVVVLYDGLLLHSSLLQARVLLASLAWCQDPPRACMLVQAAAMAAAVALRLHWHAWLPFAPVLLLLPP